MSKLNGYCVLLKSLNYVTTNIGNIMASIWSSFLWFSFLLFYLVPTQFCEILDELICLLLYYHPSKIKQHYVYFVYMYLFKPKYIHKCLKTIKTCSCFK